MIRDNRRKIIKQYKAEATEIIDDTLTGVLDIDGPMKDYKKYTLDWSWSNIMKEDDE